MKIQPNQHAQTVSVPERKKGRASAGAQRADSGTPAAHVQRSAFAASLKDVEPSRVRGDLVSEVKAALANGTFEDSVDMDRVLDGLLADL